MDFNYNDYILSDTYINELGCTCASSNFNRYVNVEIDRSGYHNSTYDHGYVLKVTGLRLNNQVAVFDCRRLIPNSNLKLLDCRRDNIDCILVINCNR